MGTLRLMTNQSVRPISTAAAKKITVIGRLMDIAITSEPTTMNGARVRRRMHIAIFSCT